MDETELPIVACANGYQFRAPAPVYMMREQKLRFGASVSDGEYALDTEVPRVIAPGNVAMQPIHQMPLRLDDRWRLFEVVYTGARRVILEITPWDNPFVEITVPAELQSCFRCCTDEDGRFFLEARLTTGHSHDGASYNGDHLDFRGAVISGGFVAKTVNVDGRGNRTEVIMGHQPSIIKLLVPRGIAFVRYDATSNTSLLVDRPLRIVD